MQFEYYREHFLFGECNSLARCFETVADFGLRSSGGIGDMMGFDGYANKAMGPRFILDLMFFVLVLIILMNVIFGASRRQQLARLASPHPLALCPPCSRPLTLPSCPPLPSRFAGIIIDTFSELRELKKKRLEHTVGTCFVCGIDKNTLDRAADTLDAGFRRHIREDHHMWSYLKFMIFLWVQDQDDDDGLELYVRQCLESDDLSWFPMDKALCLVEGNDAGGDQTLSDRLAQLQADLALMQKSQFEITDQIEGKMEELGKAQVKMAAALPSKGPNRRGSSGMPQKRNSMRRNE